MNIHLPFTGQVEVTPDTAGWDYCGLQVLTVPAGGSITVPTGNAEFFVLPLTGSATVEIAATDATAEATFELTGRASVFSAVSDFCYVGRDSVITLRSAGGAELALPSARCENRRQAKYGPAADIPVEVRGAGPATRQVTNFGTPDGWSHAERLMCCELITPPGNWSSYPPHKHDASEPCQVVDEEIYYYRIAGADQLTPSRVGFGMHRTYTGPEHDAAGLTGLDETVEVRDGDVVLIPHGYHGPCAAAPGYPMYYLNVLAGPGTERSMAFCDDPTHAWVRAAWAGRPPDPRCPVTSAAGRVDGGTA
ncbi:MAG: 5-deoxy-glucuronate isomerase [Jatrophihabitans sp.]